MPPQKVRPNRKRHKIGGDKVNDFAFAMSLRRHGSGQRRRAHNRAWREAIRNGVAYRSPAHIAGRGTR
jgi:hypothetical protein